jgi:prepilin-type N-terminal cleavage/methylation domain-containing protein
MYDKNPSGTDVAMRNPHRVSNQTSQVPLLRRKHDTGFSLVELMVAMAVFLVVGGAAVGLVKRHMPLFNTAQNQTNLNISLRNAVAQLQMEVVNAGTGFGGAGAVAFSPMGVTIGKATDNTCKGTATYISACFDSLRLIQVDTTLPIMAPSADAAATTAIDTSDSVKGKTIFLTLPGNPAGATAAQYTTWAGSLKQGTELMFVQGGTDAGPSGQPSIAIIVLQADAVQNGNSIQLSFTTAPTVAGGIPVVVPDPLRIYDAGENGRFTTTFSPGLDYVVKLVAGATYSVDATDGTNPKLIRTSAAGAQDVIAEQIIGFTVGAWSSQKVVGGVPAPGYTTNPSDYGSDWASVRSIQIQLVARATPNTDKSSTFKNAYDQGNYQVQGMSVVINPRNLNTN